MTTKKQLKVTLVHSAIHCLPRHKATVRGLGLRRMQHSVILEDTPCIRGMITRVAYLLKVEDHASK